MRRALFGERIFWQMSWSANEVDAVPRRTERGTSELAPDDLRRAMGLFPTGVTILTSGKDERVEAMTANAVMSISLEPLLVLVSVHKKARINTRIKEEGYYAISILTDHQEGLSRLFASPNRSRGLRDAAIVSREGAQTGAPLVKGSLAAIECELEAVYMGGDHDLLLGRVVAIHLGRVEEGPLVFYRGTYPTLEETSPITLQRIGGVRPGRNGVHRP